MKTKNGFGRLLKGGLDCEIIKIESGGHCAIKLLSNGNIYHGLLRDLSDVKQETLEILICLFNTTYYKPVGR